MSQKKISAMKDELKALRTKKDGPTFFRELMALEEKSDESLLDVNL